MLEVLKHPHPSLKAKCEPVAPDENLGPVLDEMRLLMAREKGLGLAANQVGIHKRFFLFKVGQRVKVAINPEIIDTSAELVILSEGCLSFPKKTRTRRPNAVRVRYENEDREPVEELIEGLEAVCFQHEYDHLKGRTILDRQYLGRVR